MKKLLYSLFLTSVMMWSCGGGADAVQEDGTAADAGAIEGTPADLSHYGMPFTITIPENNAGEAQLTATDWGGVEIRKGEGYMITMAYGAGDLALFKSDLNGDLLYKAAIVEEGADFIVYKREIPDSGMEPEYHFIQIVKSGNDVVEIQNLKDVIFNEEAIRKMHASAKTLKPNTAS